ncbi:hypothetical protein [uncultured Eudoraea sp.]|uniref:hypothetical protein n=1 Tax=uncultured Eudoraea sp. TaxID=1035614 RepID=UPI00263893BE|nr:hypothetical protein [uncultured Eudoraea sp.]
MNIKYLLSLAFVLTSFFVSAECDNTYSSASYALNHTKKSMSAKNFDHQKYYAYKALEALEKAKKLIESCGCDKAIDPILNGIENLEKAADPKDFDMGRYYTKKAFGDIQDLIGELDVYTQAGIQDENIPDYNIDKDQTKEKVLLAELTEIKKKQIKLAREQKILLKRQKFIEEKIYK